LSKFEIPKKVEQIEKLSEIQVNWLDGNCTNAGKVNIIKGLRETEKRWLANKT